MGGNGEVAGERIDLEVVVAVLLARLQRRLAQLLRRRVRTGPGVGADAVAAPGRRAGDRPADSRPCRRCPTSRVRARSSRRSARRLSREHSRFIVTQLSSMSRGSLPMIAREHSWIAPSDGELLALKRRFADAADPLVGIDADEEVVGAVRRAAERLDFGDLHEPIPTPGSPRGRRAADRAQCSPIGGAVRLDDLSPLRVPRPLSGRPGR